MSRRRRRYEYRKKSHFIDDDVNPMEGVVNIVDAMLVFACGLMLSIVIFWNVDLRPNDMVPVKQGVDQLAADELQSKGESIDSVQEGMEEIGKVYRDPVTGNIYLMEQTGEGVATGSAVARTP
jgi:hypothetical protein